MSDQICNYNQWRRYQGKSTVSLPPSGVEKRCSPGATKLGGGDTKGFMRNTKEKSIKCK
jgi:hypothetical protein